MSNTLAIDLPAAISKSKVATLGRILLVGLGHAHLEFLRHWSVNRWRCRWEVLVVTPRPTLTYSGMVTGVIAGQYRAGQAEIQSVAYARACGATVRMDQVVRIDPDARQVITANGAAIDFELASIDVGSGTRSLPASSQAIPQIGLRPLDTLFERLRAVGEQQKRYRIAVVGSGWAAIETALCLRSSGLARHEHSDWAAPEEVHLIGPALQTLHAMRAVMEQYQVGYHEGHAVAINDCHIDVDDGTKVSVDAVVLATGPSPLPFLTQLHLPLTDDGFLQVDEGLRSHGRSHIFALGDTAGPRGEVPKSGVQAIRQGKHLFAALCQLSHGKSVSAYYPREPRLQLINHGNGVATIVWGKYHATGRPWWWLKHWIDTRFVRQFDLR